MASPYTILVDSRERRPWQFERSITRKLDEGDYALAELPPKLFAIERKATPTEWHGNLLDKSGRFRRELDRLKAYATAAVILEFTADEWKAYDPVARGMRVNAKYLRSLAYRLEEDYPTIQYIYAGRDARQVALDMMDEVWAACGGVAKCVE
jgi:hypothetical protein